MMAKLVLLIFVACVVAFSGCLQSSGGPAYGVRDYSFHDDGSLIVSYANRDGIASLYRVDADGKSSVILAVPGTSLTRPHAMPNGDLSFLETRMKKDASDGWESSVWSQQAGNPVQLTPWAPAAADYTQLPGGRIVVARTGDTNCYHPQLGNSPCDVDLYVYAGGQAQRLTNREFTGLWALRPVGRNQVAFAAALADWTGPAMFLLDINNTTLTEAVPRHVDGISLLGPSCEQETGGDFVSSELYAGSGPASGRVFRYNYTRGTATKIAELPRSPSQPCASSDGKAVYYIEVGTDCFCHNVALWRYELPSGPERAVFTAP